MAGSTAKHCSTHTERKVIKCATHFSDAINSDFSRKQLCCAIFSIAEFLPLGQKYKAEFGIKSLSEKDLIPWSKEILAAKKPQSPWPSSFHTLMNKLKEKIKTKREKKEVRKWIFSSELALKSPHHEKHTVQKKNQKSCQITLF